MKKTTILGLGIGAGILLSALVCWASFDPPALENVKSLTLYVYDAEGNITTHEAETTAQYLSGVITELSLADCEETPEGLLPRTVEDMLPEEGSVWVYNVNSVRSELTLNRQPVEDGDIISFYQSELSPEPDTDPDALPPAEKPFDWQTALLGTWSADNGENLVISEARIRLMGVNNLPYYLTFNEEGDGVYMILCGDDGEPLGNYSRLTALRDGETALLYAEAPGGTVLFRKLAE